MSQLVAEPAVPAGTPPMDPEEAQSWRLGQVLLNSAREEARFRTYDFYESWRFTLGENHWPTPTSYRALLATRWQSRTVRNWLWATIDHKAAVMLDADPMIHVEPLDDMSDFVTRQKISTAISHELERLRWRDYVEDACYDGAVLGKGLIHIRVKKDRLSEVSGIPYYELLLDRVDPSRFYPDPSASRLSECRYVVWEPIMDLSTVKEIFPEKGQLVKPTITTDLFRWHDSLGYTRTDQDLVEGTAGQEYIIGKDGTLRTRRAEVAFIWIKDETLSEDVKNHVLRAEGPGYQCNTCGAQMEQSEALPLYANLGSPTMDGGPVSQIDSYTGNGMSAGDPAAAFSGVGPSLPTMPDLALPTGAAGAPGASDPTGRACVDCGSEDLTPITMPAQTIAKKSFQRKYPFGRMIALSGSILLYDGPNPHDIESVFPFAEYCHYRVPRRFWGYGDTALLKSSQRVADKNMAQALDYLRLAANGPFEYPAEAEAYASLGTGPGQLVPVPAPYINMAHWVKPGGFDREMFQMVDAINLQDFQRVGAVSDVSSGVAPGPGTSGVEVQARQRAASTRLGLHLKRLNQCRSDLAYVVYQMMKQYYVGERTFIEPVNGPQVSPSGAIAMDLSTIQGKVNVRITADPDDIQKDNLMGQNLAGAIQSGALMNPQMAPFLDIYLRGIGLPPNMAMEMQRRVQLLAATQGMAPPAPPMGPGDQGMGPEPRPEGAGPDTNQDMAFQGLGIGEPGA